MKPLRLQGYLSRVAEGYRSEPIGDRAEIRRLRHLLDVPNGVEPAFRTVTETWGRMRHALLAGDVVVDWGKGDHDVIREPHTVYCTASTKVEVDYRALEEMRATAVSSREWVFKSNFAPNCYVVCDPLGRAVLFVGANPLKRQMRIIRTQTLKRTAAILAMKAAHRRIWEATESGEEVSKETMEHAMTTAHWANRVRVELGEDALGTRCAAIFRQDDKYGWWTRLARHIALNGLEDQFPAALTILNGGPHAWKAPATAAEVNLIIELSGMKEWDSWDPPVRIGKLTGERDLFPRKRKSYVVSSKKGPRPGSRRRSSRRSKAPSGDADPGLVQPPDVEFRFPRINKGNPGKAEESPAGTGPFPRRSRT